MGGFLDHGDSIMWGMGWGHLLFTLLVILVIAALAKYLFSSNSGTG